LPPRPPGFRNSSPIRVYVRCPTTALLRILPSAGSIAPQAPSTLSGDWRQFRPRCRRGNTRKTGCSRASADLPCGIRLTEGGGQCMARRRSFSRCRSPSRTAPPFRSLRYGPRFFYGASPSRFCRSRSASASEAIVGMTHPSPSSRRSRSYALVAAASIVKSHSQK